MPENTAGAPGVDTYFDLVNSWVSSLAAGFRDVALKTGAP